MGEFVPKTISLLEILRVTEETTVTENEFEQELAKTDQIFVTKQEDDDNPLWVGNEDEELHGKTEEDGTKNPSEIWEESKDDSLEEIDLENLSKYYRVKMRKILQK